MLKGHLAEESLQSAMSALRLLPFFAVLAGCASDPIAPAPVDADPGTTAAPEMVFEPPTPPETELTASFLVGAWAPYPDVGAIDEKVDVLVEGAMDESQAVMACYLSRFIFAANGVAEFGVSVEGELSGSQLDWVFQQVNAEQLQLTLTSHTSDFPLLTASRDGDFLVLAGDPLIAGTWLRIERGAMAIDEDAATGGLARQHINQREQLRMAAVELQESMVQRQESMETMVTMVTMVKTF